MSWPLEIGDHVSLDGIPSDIRSIVAARPSLNLGEHEYRLIPSAGGWIPQARLRHIEGYSHRETDVFA